MDQNTEIHFCVCDGAKRLNQNKTFPATMMVGCERSGGKQGPWQLYHIDSRFVQGYQAEECRCEKQWRRTPDIVLQHYMDGCCYSACSVCWAKQFKKEAKCPGCGVILRDHAKAVAELPGTEKEQPSGWAATSKRETERQWRQEFVRQARQKNMTPYPEANAHPADIAEEERQRLLKMQVEYPGPWDGEHAQRVLTMLDNPQAGRYEKPAWEKPQPNYFDY